MPPPSNNIKEYFTQIQFGLIFSIDFRADWINRVGKKIRFRRKKKEKIKTENRARKALKTISLILGKNIIYIFFRLMPSINISNAK